MSGVAQAPLYSVVIPTHDRHDVLPEVLHALERQSDAPPFELVVVDDGSSDGTAEFLQSRGFGVPAKVLHQPNRGPADARNRGVAAGRGQRVAFLGDDTVPSAGWLRAHHEAWKRAAAQSGAAASIGVIGYTGWHRRMRLDPFLSYINEYGLQFGYALIEQPDDVPFNFFYTSNLSLERSLLLQEPFDTGFPYPAWEDIELSYRLSRKGFRLVYEGSATVAHDHPTDLRRFCHRQERAGYCAVVFYRRHPELGSFLGLTADGPPPAPSRSRHALELLLARALLKLRVPVSTPGLWERVLRFHYIAGLWRGWASERVEGRRSDDSTFAPAAGGRS